jgi:hypothetical protein
MVKKTNTSNRVVNEVKQFLAHEAEQSSGGDNKKPILDTYTKVSGSSLVYSKWTVPPYYDVNQIPISVKKKMRRDPQIRLALSVIKSPIMGLPLQVTSKDKDIAGFVEEVLQPIWRSVLRSSLNAVDFGHAPHEKIFEIKDVTVTDDNDVERLYPSAVVYHKLKDIDPEDIMYLNDTEGNFAGAKWKNTVIIPPEKMFVMVNEKEFGNPYGTSRFDSVYEAWYWCNIMLRFTNRYYERKADPSVKARAPVQVDNTESNSTETGMDIMSAAVNAMKSSSVIVLPNDRDDDGHLKWDCEYMLDDKRGEMFQSYINMLQVLKLRGMLVPERVLTQDSKVGSLAMVKEMTDTFLLMEQQLIADMYEHLNKFFVRALVEFNFGRNASEAILVPGSITKQNTELIKEVLFKVMDAENRLEDGKPYDTSDIVDTTQVLENLNIPTKEPEIATQPKQAAIHLSEHVIDSPVTILSIDKFAVGAMREFDISLEQERTGLEDAIGKHNKKVVKAILINLKNAKYSENRLAKGSNNGVFRNILRAVDALHEDFLNSLDIDTSRKIEKYLTVSNKLAQRHYKELKSIVTGDMQLARRQKTGVFIPGKGKGAGAGVEGMRQIIRDNEFGIQQNIQNIAKREDRVILETLKNAFDNERIMIEIEFSELAGAPQKIAIGIEEALREIDTLEFAVDKDSGLLAEVKNFRFNKSFTNSTVEAHYRAVYRRTFIELAGQDDVDVFKAYKSESSEDKGECSQYTGKIGTLNWWDVQAERLGSGGGIRQFGLHFGGKTMFYPVPPDILIKDGIKVETLNDV